MPLNVRSILTINAINANNMTANWTYVPGPGAVAENSNPNFNRTVKTTAEGVLVTKGGNSVGLPMEVLMLAVAKINPSLTWPPNYANQPANAYVGAGNTAAVSFLAVAQDEIGGDITYQWAYGANSANVVAAGVYSNVTTNHLNVSNSNGLIGTTFYLVATNPSGNGVSNTVGIYFDPSILTQPQGTTVTHPSAVQFSVLASGQTALSYQWQYGNGSNIANGGVYAGATNSTLNISNSTGLNGTNFKVLVLDTAGSVTSNNATLTVL